MRRAPAMDADDFRRLAHDAVDVGADYLAGVRTRPVFAPMDPAERRALLDQPLPHTGVSPHELLDAFERRVFSRLTPWRRRPRTWSRPLGSGVSSVIQS